VEHGKGEALRVAGDGAGDMRAAQREAAAARGVNLVGDAADAIAEELGLIGKRGKDELMA
jgi:hypothetical protein